MNTKFRNIRTKIREINPDIVAIVETWLTAQHSNLAVSNRIGLDGYSIFRRDRQSSDFGRAYLDPNSEYTNLYAQRKGGGILVAFRAGFDGTFASDANISFRYMDGEEDYFDSIMNFELRQTIECAGCITANGFEHMYGLSVVYRRPGKFKACTSKGLEEEGKLK